MAPPPLPFAALVARDLPKGGKWDSSGRRLEQVQTHSCSAVAVFSPPVVSLSQERTSIFPLPLELQGTAAQNLGTSDISHPLLRGPCINHLHIYNPVNLPAAQCSEKVSKGNFKSLKERVSLDRGELSQVLKLSSRWSLPTRHGVRQHTLIPGSFTASPCLG